jgi:DNA-binding MarR family transcriptional regulator
MDVMEPVTSAADLADLLAGIHRLVRRNLRGGLTVPRLRGGQVELLRTIAARPGIGVSAAAAELHLAGNSVSTLVNQLATAGLLVRAADPRDRRAARLFVTDAAARRLAEWERRRAELFTCQLELLDETDRAALRAAVPALRKLTENLNDATGGVR